MFISITLSAKIGGDYKSVRLGSILKDDGTFSVDFPRDMDYSKPFNMICEPSLVEKSENWGGFKVYKDPPMVMVNPNADEQEVDGFGDRPLNQDISEIFGAPGVKEHIEKLVDREKKHLVPKYPEDDNET